MASKNPTNYWKLIETVLKVIFGLFLFAVFVYWSCNAISKFIHQPIATQIKFTYGDDKFGNIQMPAITICNYNMSVVAAKLGCGFNQTKFVSLLYYCLIENPNLSINDIYESIKFSREDFAYAEIEPDILNGKKAKELQDHFWSFYIHKYHGFCYTFDASKVPEFEKLHIDDLFGNPYINIKLTSVNNITNVKVMSRIKKIKKQE
jgi:hypothetical protein